MDNKEVNRLFEIFAGEYCRFLINKDLEATTQDKSSIITTKAPLSVEGFFVDKDDVYIYTGIEPDTISGAFPVEMLVHIEIGIPEGIEELFDPSMVDMSDIPKKDEGYN